MPMSIPLQPVRPLPGISGTAPFAPTVVSPVPGAGMILPYIGSQANPNDANASGDALTRIITGFGDTLLNIGEHLLIYTIFAVLFIMLLWVIVSDQSPQETLVSVGKAVSTASEVLA